MVGEDKNSYIEHIYFWSAHHADENKTKSFKRTEKWLSSSDDLTALAVKAYGKWWVFEVSASTSFVMPSGENQHQNNLTLHHHKDGSNAMDVKIQFFCNPLLFEKNSSKLEKCMGQSSRTSRGNFAN